MFFLGKKNDVDTKREEEEEEKRKKRATQLINDCLFTIVLVMLDFLAKCHPSFSMYVFDCQNRKQIYTYIFTYKDRQSGVVNVYLVTDRRKKIILNIYICLIFCFGNICFVQTLHDENISVSCL